MPDQTIAPYGTWPSPVTPELVSGQTIGLGALSADGAVLHWLESRPTERGRTVLVRRSADGRIADLTPAPFDVASRVHEYGGGAYAAADGRVVFSHKPDGAVWLIEGDAAPRLVAAVPGCRYADFRLLGGWALCVREDHRDRTEGDPEAAIVALDLSGTGDAAAEAGRVLVRGADFYSSPRPSPDGSRLAWIEWDHPDMPWDATRLRVAELLGAAAAAGPGAAAQAPTLGAETLASTGRHSVIGPGWLADGTLLACSDQDGWWTLCRVAPDGLHPVRAMQAEVGGPHWVFGQRWWQALPDGRLLACPIVEGRSEAVLLDAGGTTSLGLHAAECPVPVIDPAPSGSAGLANAPRPVPPREPAIPGGLLPAAPDAPAPMPLLAWIGVSPEAPPAILLGRPGEAPTVLRSSAPAPLSRADVSMAEPIRFPSQDGAEAHAWWYPPTNAGFQAPAGELPPLIVMSHGGPTSMSGSAFSPRVQWWTSRGFGVVDVNYGGSTGFGRAYRQRLDGQWGVVDVADCIAAASFLADTGRVDPARMAIRGGSAGGFTVLAALTGSDAFRAGASHYGVADLRLLAGDTHKFESRYLDRLVGRLPEADALYAERSPLGRVERLSCPVIFFQGLEDKVVPPNQARVMVQAMRSRGVKAALYEFEGEGHGFRRAETMRRVLELELDFYGQVFGFKPAGVLERARLE